MHNLKIKITNRFVFDRKSLTTTPYEAFQAIEMDIVGPLAISEFGHRYALTIQGRSAKYFLAIPLVTMEAECIAEAFIEEFICRFGCPKTSLDIS